MAIYSAGFQGHPPLQQLPAWRLDAGAAFFVRIMGYASQAAEQVAATPARAGSRARTEPVSGTDLPADRLDVARL